MKRSISSSVLGKLQKTDNPHPEDQDIVETSGNGELKSGEPTAGLKPRMGGSGSAWKAGALNDTQEMLNEKRAISIDDILQGRSELSLDPAQISDEIGTDRREDWLNQDAFNSLYLSIEQNGQDSPIQVWPVDPSWKPDPLDPKNCAGVPFLLITGRRRHAIALKLGRSVRAVLASPEKRGQTDDQFEMLFMRFRENEERENLGAFERLMSVGQMFERYANANQDAKTTAVGFAKMIGVHESHVSRGKVVFGARSEILHACKNAYDLSHRELEKLVSELTEVTKPKAKKPSKPQKLTAKRKLRTRNLSIASQTGKILISSKGLNLDKEGLEGLSDVVAAYLQEQEPKI